MENHKGYKLLFLIFLISLIVGFRTFLMEYFIEPIALVCWTAWRIVSSIDQKIFWAILIVLCAVFTMYHSLPKKEAVPRSLYREKQNLPNRVEHWQQLITEAATGREEAEQLRNRLKELLGRMTVQNEGADVVDVDALAAEGRVSLPPDVEQFLFAPEQKKMNIAPKWLRRWVIKPGKREISAIDETLHWMENELEIDNGK